MILFQFIVDNILIMCYNIVNLYFMGKENKQSKKTNSNAMESSSDEEDQPHQAQSNQQQAQPSQPQQSNHSGLNHLFGQMSIGDEVAVRLDKKYTIFKDIRFKSFANKVLVNIEGDLL